MTVKWRQNFKLHLPYRNVGLCCYLLLHWHCPQCSWLHWNHLEYSKTWWCLDKFG